MELEEKEKAEKKKRGPKPSSVRFKKAFLWKAHLKTGHFSSCLRQQPKTF